MNPALLGGHRMFARFTSVQIKQHKIDAVIHLYKRSVIPAAKTQKGYKGAYLMLDRNTGKGVSVTVWDSEEDALVNEKNLYYQEQVMKFIPFYTASPIREGYEILVQD
jgi:heme-degrading monooxygenase HmoA